MLTFHSDERVELCSALVKFRGEVGAIPKNEVNPFFSTGGRIAGYADMAQILQVTGPVLAKCGLTVVQSYCAPDFEKTGAEAQIETMVLHISGQSFSSFTPCVLAYQWNKTANEYKLEQGPQAAGKTMTYARRYGYLAALCLAPGGDDDDGESGQEHFRNNESDLGRNPTVERPVASGIRRLQSKYDQVCGICSGPIRKANPENDGKPDDIAWRKDEDGKSRVAHWACYESKKMDAQLEQAIAGDGDE